MISRHSSVLRPRVLVSTPSASHSGPSGLPMQKAGSKRPSDRTSMVAHCLASSTGSRNASDTTFMPNFMRRVRPAKAAIVFIDSRNGRGLTIRSVCQIESTPPASHMSIQRQYAAAPENGNSAQPSPIPTPMCAPSLFLFVHDLLGKPLYTFPDHALGSRGCDFDA